VGGEFGQSWIKDFKEQNTPAPSKDLKKDLWSWGGKPKGKALTGGGKLVDAINNTTTINTSANWLGDTSALKNPVYMNSSSPYGNYGTSTDAQTGKILPNSAPLSPMFLSDDPWVMAQQLGRPVITPCEIKYPL
jgi:hypothetical protein